MRAWYLAAPRSCAAPNKARDMLIRLCDWEEAMYRFERGIGLPPYASVCRELGTTVDDGAVNVAARAVADIDECGILRA